MSYYYQERTSTLQVVAAIFRVSQDPNHGLVEKAKKLATAWIAAGLKEKCLQAFKDAQSAKLPSIFENYAEKAAFWTNQNLKEQQVTLFILTLGFIGNFNHALLQQPCQSSRFSGRLQSLDICRLGLQTNE